MSSSPLSLPNSPSEAFSIINSMSAVLNPYPFILQIITTQQQKLANYSLPTVVVTLGVAHLTLLLLAAITFILKSLRKDNGKRRKIWFWRRHYLLDHEIPYLVPNGNFSIELLQIFSCCFYILFSATTYVVCKYPQVPSPVTHASIIFWYAIAIVPDAAAFWWGGWGAFYLVFLSPTRLETVQSKRKIPFIHQPLFMNTICLGVPVGFATYFLSVGTKMAVELKQIIELYNLLLRTLGELSALWKPDDPLHSENNQILFNILEALSKKSTQISYLAQTETYGWAVVSVSTIAFYLGATIAAGKLLKHTLLIATGEKVLGEKPAHQGKSSGFLNQSISTIDSKVARSEEFKPTFVQCPSTLRLKRGYYFIYISCAIMFAVLGLNVCISIIFALKTKMVLVETYWQIRLLTMICCTSVLLSFSLFLQSLMLLLWG
ncbi:hypothetical protein PtA15_10A671 [Puccinia triticina]|uniref:Uncharacterized protein n=1 Tax=Puccinia triticina TaxID=208348 RepID=A0ABY7D2R1_9BASI|nr:uncharacterized protein PtA15_10A671 [Puccinia triticina]WAQ89247.1 hypothetical protein PtA15_10A671 [Puccinia triticina]WAR59299.1 hypothetical protein PtB15_10B641 [Puccinia triticina]